MVSPLTSVPEISKQCAPDITPRSGIETTSMFRDGLRIERAVPVPRDRHFDVADIVVTVVRDVPVRETTRPSPRHDHHNHPVRPNGGSSKHPNRALADMLGLNRRRSPSNVGTRTGSLSLASRKELTERTPPFGDVVNKQPFACNRRSHVGFEARTGDLAPQHGKLMAQHEDLNTLRTIPTSRAGRARRSRAGQDARNGPHTGPDRP